MSKTKLQNIYTTRLISSNTDGQRDDGTVVKINYQVDLVTAFDNSPGADDYDPEIPMRSGTKIRITYRTPESFRNKVFFALREQAEHVISELQNPNSDLYAAE